jgi:hypothetical protein
LLYRLRASTQVMNTLASWRPFVLGLCANALVFLGLLVRFNYHAHDAHGNGFSFFTIDDLMFLLPLLVSGNALLCLVAFAANKPRWTKAFGVLLLLLLGGCTATWVQGYATGVTS